MPCEPASRSETLPACLPVGAFSPLPHRKPCRLPPVPLIIPSNSCEAHSAGNKRGSHIMLCCAPAQSGWRFARHHAHCSNPLPRPSSRFTASLLQSSHILPKHRRSRKPRSCALLAASAHPCRSRRPSMSSSGNIFAALAKSKSKKEKKPPKEDEGADKHAELEAAIFSKSGTGLSNWADSEDEDWGEPAPAHGEGWSEVGRPGSLAGFFGRSQPPAWRNAPHPNSWLPSFLCRPRAATTLPPTASKSSRMSPSQRRRARRRWVGRRRWAAGRRLPLP